MSFINMLANDVWSDSDISRKVQALIRSKFSQEDELKAARLARQENKTDAENTFIVSVDSTIASALAEGKAAREDMALLTQVLNVEECKRILSLPEVEPILDEQGVVTNQAVIDVFKIVAENCQATIDAASQEVKDLLTLRENG